LHTSGFSWTFFTFSCFVKIQIYFPINIKEITEFKFGAEHAFPFFLTSSLFFWLKFALKDDF